MNIIIFNNNNTFIIYKFANDIQLNHLINLKLQCQIKIFLQNNILHI